MKLKKYVIPANPIALSSQKYIDDLIANARKRRTERQTDACVGDTVWCKFNLTPAGAVSPGIIIRIEIDTQNTVYTVLPEGSIEYEVFLGEDFGKTIFMEEDL